MFEEQPLFMKKKPNFGKDFLILKNRNKEDSIYKEKIKDGFLNCYNDASFKTTNSNGDVIEEGYLTSLGLYAIRSKLKLIDLELESKKMEILRTLNSENELAQETGKSWYTEVYPKLKRPSKCCLFYF